MKCISRHLWPAIDDSMRVKLSVIYAFPHKYTHASPFVPQRAWTGGSIESDLAYDAMKCIPGHLWPAIDDSMRVKWSAIYAFPHKYTHTSPFVPQRAWTGGCIESDLAYDAMKCIPGHLWPVIHDSMSVIWLLYTLFHIYNYTFTSPIVPQRACTGGCIESDFTYGFSKCIPGHLWPGLTTLCAVNGLQYTLTRINIR